jgi:hypothetical protein
LVSHVEIVGGLSLIRANLEEHFHGIKTDRGRGDVTPEGLVTSTVALSSTTGCGAAAITMTASRPILTGGVNSTTGASSLVKG